MSSRPEDSNKWCPPYSGGVNRKGFALVLAILAVLILMALGILAINVSTGDLKISARVFGDKKALSATETGMSRLTVGFDPFDLDHISLNGEKKLLTSPLGNPVEFPSDSSLHPSDPNSCLSTDSCYTISGLSKAALNNRDIAGNSDWQQKPYRAMVTGKNTSYGGNVQVDVGVGYAVPTVY